MITIAVLILIDYLKCRRNTNVEHLTARQPVINGSMRLVPVTVKR
jgi:hypothetical protein